MHAIDQSKGRSAIAYRGEVPWHGLGSAILPQDSIDDIRVKAGIDYDVVKAPVQFEHPSMLRIHGAPPEPRELSTMPDRFVLYRNDLYEPLSVVGSRYQIVQPKEIVEFYRDLTDRFGFKLEVVGALHGGRRVWALADTREATAIGRDDVVKGYVLLATSYDGTMATQARFTSVRVVCHNTLTLAVAEGRPAVSIPHSTKFDADRVKAQLRIGEGWERFERESAAMTQRELSHADTVRLFLDVYYGLDSPEKIRAFQQDEKNNAKAEKLIERLTKALFESPGAQMASARGTLWGALNAVTFDVDHQLPSRTADARLDKAWFGTGDAMKQRALARARQLIA